MLLAPSRHNLMGAWGPSKQGCASFCPLRLDHTGQDAKEKAMASLVQYTKVRGQVGEGRARGPALWPPRTPEPQPSLFGHRLPYKSRSSASVRRMQTGRLWKASGVSDRSILGPYICSALDLGARSPSVLVNSGKLTGGYRAPIALTYFYSRAGVGCVESGQEGGAMSRWLRAVSSHMCPRNLPEPCFLISKAVTVLLCPAWLTCIFGSKA